MKLSSRLDLVKPSSTMAVTAKVLELKAAGRDVIGLAAGEPDFDTWPHVCEAARGSIARGDFRYTAVSGSPELKEAVAVKLERDNGLSYAPSEIIASCGGKHSLYNVMQALFGEGDEVVVPGPYWVSYVDMVALAGATPKVVMGSEADGFKLRPEDLEAAIGPATRAVIINSPSNPTGAAYSGEEMAALAAVLARNDCWVISDDVYEMIRYDGARPEHLFKMEPGLRERGVLCNSVSKTYAMTGWRIGYTAAPAPVVKAMGTLQGQSTSNPTAVAQAAAAAALSGPQDELEGMVAEFRNRRDYVCERIAAIDGLSVGVPEGAFYVFVNVAGALEAKGLADGDAFAMAVLENASVGVVGGNDFGSTEHIRISYATSMENLEQSLDRIGSWLASD